MQFSHLLGSGTPRVARYRIGSTVVTGQPVIWVAAGAGSVEDPAAVTDLTKAAGLCISGGTYATTAEVKVPVLDNPNLVVASRVVPSATAGTDYAAADGYLLEADSADANKVTIADTDTGGTTNDAIDGLLFCLTGENAGQARVITAHTGSTSVVVTVEFDNAIAAGDTFVFSQYAPGVVNAQMTSDFTELDGTIAGGTGGEAVIQSVRVKTENGYSASNPYLEATFTFRDHMFNPMS